MHSLRLFVAIPTTPLIQAEIARHLERLQAMGADFKWVEPANLHWTLHFFGKTEPDRLGGIGNIMREAASACPPFRVVLGRGGAFPSLQSPRVVWIGLQQGEDKMGELAARLRGLLRQHSYPVEERPFRTHLTLGRRRSSRKLAGFGKAVESVAGEGTMEVDHIALYQSQLSAQGPTYEILDQVPLRVA